MNGVTRSFVNRLLHAELSELANCSQRFVTAIDNHNYLPEDFPEEVAKAICASLENLHAGSVEGCRLPLEHAIVRLSEIRTDYFSLPFDQTNEQSGSANKEVRLERGDSLDQALTQLISSATTSLDAYRRQLRESFELRDESDFLELALPSDEDLAFSPGIRGTLDRLSEFRSAIPEDADKSARLLAVATADVENSAKATQSELSARPIIRKWLKLLAVSTRVAALTARTLGKTVKGAIYFGAPLYRRWDAMWDDFFEFGINQAELWADEAVSLSERLERKPQTIPPVDNVDRKRVTGQIHRTKGVPFVFSLDGKIYRLAEEFHDLKIGQVVSFLIGRGADGEGVAVKVQPEGDIVIWRGKAIAKSQAHSIAAEQIKKIMAKNGTGRAVHTKVLLRQLTKDFTPKDWIGDDSSELFATIVSSMKGYSIQKVGRHNVVARGPVDLSPVHATDMLDWAASFLESIPGNGISIGELASEFSRAFGAGIVSPKELLLDAEKFSTPFFTDKRFRVVETFVSLTK